MVANDQGLERAAVFAAQHWGGAGVVPEFERRVLGRRDVDGGRPEWRNVWTFVGDGFRYIVSRLDDDGRGLFCVEASDGSGARFWPFGDSGLWTVAGFYRSGVYRVGYGDDGAPVVGYPWPRVTCACESADCGHDGAGGCHEDPEPRWVVDGLGRDVCGRCVRGYASAGFAHEAVTS